MESDELNHVRRRRVYLEAFGCQMNVLDGELVLSTLDDRGWAVADNADDADLVIFNTCSVRAHAHVDSTVRLRELRSHNSDASGRL